MKNAAKKQEFDPLQYIENAFLDRPKKNGKGSGDEGAEEGQQSKRPAIRFRKTSLSAPRPRRVQNEQPEPISTSLRELWESVPRNIEYLTLYFDDSVTANYYQGEFKETREDLIRRLLDPELTLEEVSRILGVCPATVRRYTNRGWLQCHRTKGGQRRFRLGGVVKFVQEHGRHPEE